MRRIIVISSLLAVVVTAVGVVNFRRNAEILGVDWRLKKNLPTKEVQVERPQRSLIIQTVTAPGTIELVEAQFSDAEGNLLAVKANKLAPPTKFALMQNYPNPFNAGTNIRLALPTESDWSLRIYNIVGQMVDEFTGHSAAGYVDLHWSADRVASGIYFYKLTAGEYTATKKMTLMK